MVIDITGAILRPGNHGKDCMANGLHPEVECACDECDYFLCCWDLQDPSKCKTCMDRDCPNAMHNRLVYRLG